MLGNIVRSVNLANMGSLPHHPFWSYFLDQKQCRMDIVIVDNEFCKSMDGSFNISIVRREGISISNISIYYSKNKVLLLPWWKCFNVINLLPDYSWLITPKNGATLETQYRSLILLGRAYNSGYFYVGLAKWKPKILRPCKTSFLATMAILILSPLGNERND